jgi:hypothetical protein
MRKASLHTADAEYWVNRYDRRCRTNCCGGGSDHHRGFRVLRRKGARPDFTSRADHGEDNLSAHKGERVRELVEGRGCELLYLPPYSPPDLDPIEQAFSKVKGLLRRAEARTREALIEAMGRALYAVTARDARGFFEHCGCRAPVQPLPKTLLVKTGEA